LRVPAPEAGASTNSAIWALTRDLVGRASQVNTVFELFMSTFPIFSRRGDVLAKMSRQHLATPLNIKWKYLISLKQRKDAGHTNIRYFCTIVEIAWLLYAKPSLRIGT
jgi:hypothetical protein